VPLVESDMKYELPTGCFNTLNEEYYSPILLLIVCVTLDVYFLCLEGYFGGIMASFYSKTPLIVIALKS